MLKFLFEFSSTKTKRLRCRVQRQFDCSNGEWIKFYNKKNIFLIDNSIDKIMAQ